MTRAYAIAGALQQAGAGVEIVGALEQGAAIYPVPPAGIDVRAVCPSPFPRRVAQTRALARGEVLYAIKPRATSFGVGLLVRGGRRLVVDVDDFEPGFTSETPPGSLPDRVLRSLRHVRNLDHRGYTRLMERWLGRASVVTANTRVLAERHRAVYLPSGKDTRLFDPARFDADRCRRELGLEGLRVVMFPGTPRPHKGVEDVLEAMERLDWPDARLVLVGGREAGEAFTDRLVERYGRRIVRLGRFAAADMPRIVAAAHVVVATQRDTPAARAQFPMKLTDAMAMAKPIVSTRVGDIPAILGAGAWLVAPESPAEIAGALEEIFADPARAARRGREARERCEQSLSFSALAAILAGVVGDLGGGVEMVSSSL